MVVSGTNCWAKDFEGVVINFVYLCNYMGNWPAIENRTSLRLRQKQRSGLKTKLGWLGIQKWQQAALQEGENHLKLRALIKLYNRTVRCSSFCLCCHLTALVATLFYSVTWFPVIFHFLFLYMTIVILCTQNTFLWLTGLRIGSWTTSLHDSAMPSLWW